MSAEIMNIYVETLLNEIDEINRKRFIAETNFKFIEKMNESLNLEIAALREELNKSASKKTKKEVNTSDEF